MKRTNTSNVTIRNAATDVIVLSVSSAGEDLSLRLLNVALDVLGIAPGLVRSECPYRARLPSTTMVQAAKAVKEAGRISRVAGESDKSTDWRPVAGKARWMTRRRDDSVAGERYRNRAGPLIDARRTLTGPQTTAVWDHSFTARRGIAIGTGSERFVAPITGIDKVHSWTTHDVIAMDKVSTLTVVLGGGSSGCELGQVVARFGAKVTLVEAKDQRLP